MFFHDWYSFECERTCKHLLARNFSCLISCTLWKQKGSNLIIVCVMARSSDIIHYGDKALLTSWSQMQKLVLKTLVPVSSVLGLEHFCSWPREGLASEGLFLALASDFFVSSAWALCPRLHLWWLPPNYVKIVLSSKFLLIVTKN